MFLFAQLVMDNLLDQTNSSDVRREVGPDVFPDGLEQL